MPVASKHSNNPLKLIPVGACLKYVASNAVIKTSYFSKIVCEKEKKWSQQDIFDHLFKHSKH